MLPSYMLKQNYYAIFLNEIVFINFEYLKQNASFPVLLVTSVPVMLSPVQSIIIFILLILILVTAVFILPLFFLLLSCHQLAKNMELHCSCHGNLLQVGFLRDAEDVFERGVDDESLALLVWCLVQSPPLQKTVTTAQLGQRQPEQLCLYHLWLPHTHTEIRILRGENKPCVSLKLLTATSVIQNG